MTLFDLKEGQTGIITKVKGRGAFRKRITEMGFIKGKEVKMIKHAPLRDPIEFRIMNYEVSLRRSESLLVEIITPEEAAKQIINGNFEGVTIDEIVRKSAREKGKIIDVALVGNPNSGKTTLFNYASSSNAHVGNFAGVTVEARTAKFKQNGYTFNIVDLPGTYSLSAYSPEELYVRKHILGNFPDIVINVVDASNLERNLYLTTQLIDMDVKVVIALNMYDELVEKGDKFDYVSLGKMIGIPMVPTVSSKGKGIKELFSKVIDVYEDSDPDVRHVHINYGECIENSIQNIQNKIRHNPSITDKVSSRYYAIKLLEKDKGVNFIVSRLPNSKEINETTEKEIKKIETLYLEDSETQIIDAKYGFIAGALKETYVNNKRRKERTETEVIDTFLTHRLFGFPVFIFFIWLMFQATFSLGAYPMQWIEALVGFTNNAIETSMPEGILKNLLTDGIISGVGGVLVFLPNILILFFFIAFMEDTGYMARAAFIMDRIMHKIGLHGKSFIPLLMGFGCNVPAIMATRTLNNRNDRLLTMLINPFMSCSARLPVYLLMAGAFFADNAGTMVFIMYGIGLLLAVFMALIFKKFLFKGQEAPFVMELPPYRVPTVRTIFKHMWNRGAQYLNKIGGVILIASIVIWALGYFPINNKREQEHNQEIITLISNTYNDYLNTTKQIDRDKLIKDIKQEITTLEYSYSTDKQLDSYIGRLGKAIEPIMKPLGFDWKMTISLLAGLPAKEIIVSTMGVLYQADTDAAANKNTSLENKLKNERYESVDKKGQAVITPLVAFSFMLFVLIYFPCIGTIITISRESGSWKWGFFSLFYTTALAWIISFCVYQFGLFLQNNGII